MSYRNFLLPCFLACLLGYSGFGQDKTADSLKNVLSQKDANGTLVLKEDSNRVKTLIALSWNLFSFGNSDSAFVYADKAKLLAEKIGYKKGIATAYYCMGQSYIQDGNYSKALETHLAGLKLRQEMGNKKGVSASYNSIAMVFENLGNFPEALKYNFASLKISEEIGEKKITAGTYNNIGNIFETQRNFSEALKNYLAALKINRETGNINWEATNLGNIGMVYLNQNKYEDALKSFADALKIKEEIGDKQGIANAFSNIAQANRRQGNFSEALKNEFAVLKITEEIGDRSGSAASLINLGATYLDMKDYKHAEEYCTKGLNLASEKRFLEWMQHAYKNLSEIYAFLGKDKEALENYKSYIVTRDSLFNEENTKKTVQTQMQYEFDKKEATTEAENSRKEAVAAAESKKQKIIIYAVSGGLFLILILAVVILRSLRINQKKNKIITEQKDLVEKQKEIVEEKQKEILDSIHYAKRIQTALLPSEKYIKRNIKSLFSLLLFLYSCFCVAQQKEIDSLKQLLKITREDTEKIKILYEISNLSMDDKVVLDYAQQSLALATKLSASKDPAIARAGKIGAAAALNNIGFVYNGSGDITKALEYANKALVAQLELNDKKAIGTSYNNIGKIYQDQGNISGALEYYHKGLRIQEEINDKEAAARSLNNIGSIYYYQENFPVALEYYIKSLKIKEEINDKRGIAGSLNNIGSLYNKQAFLLLKRAKISKEDPSAQINSLLDKALKNFTKSLAICEEIQFKPGMAYCLNNIGNIYDLKENYTDALSYYQKGLLIREEVGDKQGKAYSLNVIGGIFLKLKKYVQAEHYCRLSLEVSQEIGYPESIRNASEQLYRVYKTLAAGPGQSGKSKYLQQALEMHELFKTMSDSINNVETHKSGLKKQMQYEFDKKEAATAAENSRKEAVAAAESKKQKIIIYAVSGGLFLILILAVVILRSLRINQKKNKIITEQKDLVEKQKEIVEEKQKEILDSIHYAKRIQTALLPSEKYVAKFLRK